MLRFACVALVLCTPLIGAEPKDQLASMKWLAGNWEGPMWGGTFHAHYSTPDGGMILSYSELRRGEKVAFHEFEKFHTSGGAVMLTPYPGGKPKPGFKLAKSEKDRAVFENPTNDFPTRITYHRAASDRLVITLSEIKGEKKQVFDLKRS